MIGVVDYGSGNIASVANMLKRVGLRSQISSDHATLESCTHLIVPGVGSFDHGMAQLRRLGLDDLVKKQASAGKPVLGICLGMQLLADGSEEGDMPGLGLIDGFVRYLSAHKRTGLPVPHVGWNEVAFRPGNGFFEPEGRQRFYFTHSYQFVCSDPNSLFAESFYGAPVTAGVVRDNVAGVQFHPEKSHRFGMALLKAFGAAHG